MENLHGQLIQACEYYAMLDRYDNAVMGLMDKNVDLEIDYESINSKGFRAAPGILIIIFSNIFLLILTAVIGVSIAYQNEIVGALFVYVSMLLIIPLTAGGILFYKLGFCRARTRKIQKKAREEWIKNYGQIKENNEKTIDRLVDERNNFAEKNNSVLDFLPDIYRSQLAAAFMERVVRTGRAETLKEAINLFEEQLHRWTLEEQGRQMLQQKELQTAMIQDQLTSILYEQRKATNSLQNLEALEFYNSFCR